MFSCAKLSDVSSSSDHNRHCAIRLDVSQTLCSVCVHMCVLYRASAKNAVLIVRYCARLLLPTQGGSVQLTIRLPSRKRKEGPSAPHSKMLTQRRLGNLLYLLALRKHTLPLSTQTSPAMSSGTQPASAANARPAPYCPTPRDLNDPRALTAYIESMGVRTFDRFCLCCGQPHGQDHRSNHTHCTSTCWMCGVINGLSDRVCPYRDQVMSSRQR